MKRIATGIILLFLALTGLRNHCAAQEAIRFHADPVAFIGEVKEYLGGRRPLETQALLKSLEDANISGKLEDNQWIDLAKKANRLNYLDARPFPEFHLFLQSFLKITATGRPVEDYRSWSAWVDKLLNNEGKNLNRLSDFLNFTLEYLNSGILTKSASFSWLVPSKTGQFEIDSLFCIRFQNVSLVGRSGSDSTQIRSTNGKFYPSSGLWAGDSGTITWERLGIPADQVKVLLGDYSIDLLRSVYTIDSVNLIDKRYFSEPLVGRVENKVQPGISADQAGYPRFTSYNLKNRIKNLYPGMDYEGGFSLQGKKVLGTGDGGAKSNLVVFYQDAPRFRFASTYFVFEPDMARGINTEASIYLEADSIYHPGLLFQYNAKRKELALIRDGQGMSPSRYFDYYHDFDFDVEMIRWTPGDSLVSMSSMVGSIENRASFESADYFSIARYNEILIEDKKHPVAVIKQCAEYFYSRTFTLKDIADYLNQSENLVEKMLLRLSFLGFVRYNTETQLVEVLERAYDFLKKNAGAQDYDIIRFQSVHKPPEANAILNLNSHTIKVFWVNSVEISPIRNVVIYPDGQTVELLKDRNILFSGKVQGGLASLTGEKMRFLYDDFSIQMDSLTFMQLRVYDEPPKGSKTSKIVDVTSLVENTSGRLLIDKPDNKSGYRAPDLPMYPMIRTDSNAYVYYDQKEILNGIYPRKTFNFTLYPFLLKGLNSKTLADSLNFQGQFMTSDIFPPIELELKHQKDHSLGFQTLKTPAEGYPVYKGKGRFYNTMAMSKAGLHGSGKLEYLNSAIESNDILFLPDQVITLANTFAVNRDTADIGNPEAVGQEMAIKWTPEKDQLIASGKNNPLDLYGKVEFDGDLSLQPDGLTGKGTIKFDRFSITSSKFLFYQRSFEAEDSELRIYRDSVGTDGKIKYISTGKNEFIARHMNGIVSIQDSMAAFKPFSSSAQIEFPINQFSGLTRSVTWDMSRERISLDSSRFRMTRSASDQLEIPSDNSDYYLKINELKAHQVEFLDVADVRIFPADRNITIREGARLDSLRQAVIVSRDTSLIHRITGATVSIIDHKDYRGRGYYQYKDIAGREFPVTFSDIRPGQDGISLAKGTIPINSDFSLSPAFKYYGQIEWNNQEKFLLFDGHTQINHSCNENKRNWIRFTDRINPDSVSIPIDSVTTNDQTERLFKGFFLSNQPVELYSTFIGPHLRYSDQPLITTWGKLWYDEGSKSYLLTSAGKKANPKADGPVLSYNSDNCTIGAEGKIDLGVDLGKMKIQSAGILTQDQRKDSLYGSVILTADFYLDSKLLDFMAKTINNASGTEPVNYGDAGFKRAFNALLGNAKGDELLAQLGILGRWRRVPEELVHTLTLTDLRFKWNPETGSYQSVGKIGIGNIMDEAVNKKVDGYLEIVHRRGGDSFNLYLETDRQTYFFFTYSRGVMQCLAGPKAEKFNNLIRDAKESKRIQDAAPGEPSYQYYLGQYRQVQEFLGRFGVER
jgi:hypothetical protein